MKKKIVWWGLIVLAVSIFFSSGVLAAVENSNTQTIVSLEQANTEEPADEIGVAYCGHIQNLGDMPKPEGTMATGAFGTRGEGLRIEGLRMQLTGTFPENANIVYAVHIQNTGWLEPVKNGELAGTVGESLRIESITISLENLPGYDVYYRGHVQNRGDTPMKDGVWDWLKNGEALGTTGSGLRLEELEVKLVKRPDVTYAEAGIYGPESGVDVIDNNVVINKPDVVLQNLHILGNLTIGAGVGDGDVTLNNVTVDGQTFVQGGGPNSIHINGGQYHQIVIMQTPSGQTRIVAIGTDGLEVVIAEDAQGEDIVLEGSFDQVTVAAPGIQLSTQGDTTITDLIIAGTAGGCDLLLDSGTTVANLLIEGTTKIKGKGTVLFSEVHANGVIYEKAPVEQTVDPAVTVPPVVIPPYVPSPVNSTPTQATPTFDPAAGAVAFGTTVTITSAGADHIYYTTDGSDPVTAVTGSTREYTAPVVIDGADTVKAIAVKSGAYNSAIATAAYTQAASADLTGLALSGTPTNYCFTGSSYTYNGVTVANDVASVIVTPTGAGTITVDEIAVTSGTASAAIALVPGVEKTITVVATETGKTAKTYTIKVTRAEPTPAVPTVKVTNLSFTDNDLDSNQIGGNLTWTPPADVSNVTHYVVYASTDGIAKGGQIGSAINVNTDLLVIPLNTSYSAYLIVIAKNAVGEAVAADYVSLAVTDRTMTYSPAPYTANVSIAVQPTLTASDAIFSDATQTPLGATPTGVIKVYRSNDNSGTLLTEGTDADNLHYTVTYDSTTKTFTIFFGANLAYDQYYYLEFQGNTVYNAAGQPYSSIQGKPFSTTVAAKLSSLVFDKDFITDYDDYDDYELILNFDRDMLTKGLATDYQIMYSDSSEFPAANDTVYTTAWIPDVYYTIPIDKDYIFFGIDPTVLNGIIADSKTGGQGYFRVTVINTNATSPIIDPAYKTVTTGLLDLNE